MKEVFEARTAEVRVSSSALVNYFDEGSEPVFKVRGLTYEELSKCNNAADTTPAMRKLLEELNKKDGAGIATEIKNVFGVGNDTPANVIKAINHVVTGCVDPEIDEEMAVKLATAFPIEFGQISMKIVELTGQGHVPGKQKSSTAKPTSEPA